MHPQPMILVCSVVVISTASCSNGKSPPRSDKSSGMRAAVSPARRVSVQVNTEPRHRPRLTVGPGVGGPPRPARQQVGGHRITAERCTIQGSPLLSHTRAPPLRAVTRVGAKLYVVDGRHALRRYDVLPGKTCILKPDTTWEKGGVYPSKLKLERLSSDGRNTVVASSYLGSVVIREGKVVYKCTLQDQGHVAVHASGTWGLAAFAGSDTQKLAFGPRSCGGIAWYLTHLKDDAKRKGPFRLINSIGFFGELALVGGSLAIRVKGWHPQTIVAFDKLGRRRFQLGALVGQGAERFQWIRAVAACGPRRICVLDSGAKRLTLWGATGTFLGAVALPHLVGVKAPVVQDFTPTAGGVAYLAVTRGRASAAGARPAAMTEGQLYRVVGLAGAKP